MNYNLKEKVKKIYYNITQKTVPRLTNIGTVDWTNNDLINKLDEFSKLYEKKPVKNNQGGMKAPQMFPIWFLIQKMKFPYIIESGIWYGQGTWFFEQASSESKIFSIDPDLSRIRYRSKNVEYRKEDFFEINWNNLVEKKKTLCFFDDHQNALERVRYAVKNGWKYLVFEDNYPTNIGDCVSLKQVFDENSTDADFLKEHIKIYYEFPPIYKVEYTRWGDKWDNIDYPTHQPLQRSLENDKRRVYLDEIEQYTWICYVELKN